MIDFELSFQYENESVPALRTVSGSIKEGSCVVLCGGSGCGKTTLLRCMNRLIPTFYEGKFTGSCKVFGQDTESLSPGEMGETAASVFQDPRSQFFTVNSSSEVAFALENHGISHERMQERVDAAFRLFDLEKLKNRNVYELSSGERQLISILSAWATDARILALDEPTANLDFAAVKRLREILMLLKKEGRTIVISEHRLHYLTGLADEYWVMENGRIIRRMLAKEMLSLSAKELSALSLRVVDLKQITYQPQTEQEAVRKNTLCLQDISFRYRKQDDLILDRISLTAETGEIVGLIGSNGSGKTTLGKLAAGLIKPAGGTVQLNGIALKGKALQKQAWFVMQEAEFQLFTNSVWNELLYGSRDSPEFRQKAEQLLRRFDLWECRNRHPFSLSGGQMQKLVLLLAYLSPKTVVVLDEPTAGLDEKSLQSCMELIREMQKTKIVLIITHDLELIAGVCTRCVSLSGGRITREFALSDEKSLQKITTCMEETFRLTDNRREPDAKEEKSRLDPRTKLLIIFVAMLAASLTSVSFVTTTAILVMIMALAEGFYKSAFTGGVLWLALNVLGCLFPDTFLSFIAYFFPRMIVTLVGVETVIGKDEASKTLAALRKIHLPEKLIMICSVTFRFFPVLSNDMKLMAQALRTRRNRMENSRKNVLDYIEILIVPMALRVIRIAETLSASAETRGIGLKRKRDTYISIAPGLWDAVFVVLLILSVILGVTL